MIGLRIKKTLNLKDSQEILLKVCKDEKVDFKESILNTYNNIYYIYAMVCPVISGMQYFIGILSIALGLDYFLGFTFLVSGTLCFFFVRGVVLFTYRIGSPFSLKYIENVLSENGSERFRCSVRRVRFTKKLVLKGYGIDSEEKVVKLKRCYRFDSFTSVDVSYRINGVYLVMVLKFY